MSRQTPPTTPDPFAAYALLTTPPPAMAEAMHFMARRFRAYGDYLEELAAASEPAAFMRAHVAFMQRVGAEYAAEAKTVAKIVTPPQP